LSRPGRRETPDFLRKFGVFEEVRRLEENLSRAKERLEGNGKSDRIYRIYTRERKRAVLISPFFHPVSPDNLGLRGCLEKPQRGEM
jgi:hypothetical protein